MPSPPIADTRVPPPADDAARELEAIMRSAPVAILFTREQRIVRGNAMCARMFGIEGEHGIGVPARALYRSDEEYAALARAAAPLLSAGRPFQQELWMRRQNGTDFWANLIGCAIDPQHPNAGTIWFCEDRSAIKQAQAALAQRTQALARANADLEQFAYVASHDLQEPLRMVGSYMQLLEKRYRDQLDRDAREFIDFAVDGARRMQALINDLLLFSRIGSRGKPFVPTDGEAVLATALANLRVAIDESGAEIAHARLPTVIGDAAQLVLLFQNLIDNAIKFRGERPARIEIAVEAQDGAWRFAVRDSGIGIAPAHVERIFVLFQRLHGRSAYPGTGIGLAVCKKVVERHGGRLWVESAPGSGSTFYFTLPREQENVP